MDHAYTYSTPERSRERTAVPETPPSETMKILRKEHQEIHRYLATIERKIYETEEDYITSTPYGNIVKGWEGLLESKPNAPPKTKVEMRERIFTHSSYSFWRVYMRYFKEKYQHGHPSHHHGHFQPQIRERTDTMTSDFSVAFPADTPNKSECSNNVIKEPERGEKRMVQDVKLEPKRMKTGSPSKNYRAHGQDSD